MSEVLEIAQLGNPILWTIADAITDPGSETTVRLADSLTATMCERGSVGLAAPQVGVFRACYELSVLPSIHTAKSMSGVVQFVNLPHPEFGVNADEIDIRFQSA